MSHSNWYYTVNKSLSQILRHPTIFPEQKLIFTRCESFLDTLNSLTKKNFLSAFKKNIPIYSETSIEANRRSVLNMIR